MNCITTSLRFGLLVAIVVLASCNGKPVDPSAENFDKGAMLLNIGGAVIQPAYANWKAKTEELSTAYVDFETEKSEANFLELQTKFLSAYEAWQTCSVFEFGPAADQNLRLLMNTFPCDTAQIESNVASGQYDLGAAINSDARSFPAIDYLLFGRGNNAETLAELTSSTHFTLQYLEDNLQIISNAANDVSSAWENYLEGFKSNTASSVGSPISVLVNEINYEFELFKNARIGIPLGKKTLGISQVETLEAFYSDHSLTLALANLQGIKSAFTGGSDLGLDDYLDAIDAQYDGGKLSVAIINGFVIVENELRTISSLKDAIETNPSSLEPAYHAIEQLVVLLKTDLPSQLGVQITYQDNDGD